MSMYYDRRGKPMTLMEGAEKFEDIEYRRVALDTVGEYEVSTVWLGLDHRFGGDGPPIIFETMIFHHGGSSSDEYCRRYSTEDEALVGHREVVKALNDGVLIQDLP